MKRGIYPLTYTHTMVLQIINNICFVIITNTHTRDFDDTHTGFPDCEMTPSYLRQLLTSPCFGVVISAGPGLAFTKELMAVMPFRMCMGSLISVSECIYIMYIFTKRHYHRVKLSHVSTHLYGL